MVESLIENLHRSDLNSVERENYITKLWETGNYKDRTQLAKILGLSDSSLMNIIEAKKIRGQTLAARVISTRTIQDVTAVKDIEDKKKIFKKLEKGEIAQNKVRDIARVVSKATPDVKKAFFSNKISVEQASKISKITSPQIRQKMITAHKEIKSIDKGIEKHFEKIKPKNESQTLKIKEILDGFRTNTIENQKVIQSTIRSLMSCIKVANLMDDNQTKKLRHNQELLEMNLNNALELSERLKAKISA